MRLLLALCLAFVVSVCAISSDFPKTTYHSDHNLKGDWKANPELFKELKDNDEAKLPFVIAVKQRNTDTLEKILWKVSDPDSSAYGKHLTLANLRDLISSSEADRLTVEKWLVAENGIRPERIRWAKTMDMIQLLLTISEAERIFDTSFMVYQRSKNNKMIFRSESGEYSLPVKVGGAVDMVSGILHFPRHSDLKRAGPSSSRLSSKVTPSVVRKQYGIPDPKQYKVNLTNTGQAVAEFQESFSPSDLQTFFKRFDPSLEGQEIDKIYGNNHPSVPGTESNLDVQYIMSMGSFVTGTVYNYFGDQSIEYDLLEWVSDLSSEDSPPLVHSVSYGAYGGSYPSREVHRLDQEFQKLGVRGLSILFASGDNGVGCNIRCTSFEPDFPSSPYITMVGSTQLTRSSGDEVAATFSSGGFADLWTRPSYQDSSVSAFLSQSDLPSSSFFNSSGRGYPDVSTLGVNVQIVHDGETEAVDGTSCSSPMLAGMLSLLNDVRLNANKPPLGFFNPVLYSWASSEEAAFFDVVSGNNADSCCPGFDAVAGWDAVTGLGTPHFATWLQLVKQLP